MKKVVFLLLIVFFFVFADATLFAQGSNSGQGTNTQVQQRLLSPSPSGDALQNQNRLKNQNEGDDVQIQVKSQEQESEVSSKDGEGKGISSRSENAREHMSVVAAKVEELLTNRPVKGGIGEQVSKIAQEQKEAQQQIQANFEKIEKRSGIVKFIIGLDFNALKNMQRIIEQNQVRIQELAQLKSQLTNQGDIDKVQEAIQALVDQNVALQDRIDLEERSSGLFGWIFRFFAK